MFGVAVDFCVRFVCCMFRERWTRFVSRLSERIDWRAECKREWVWKNIERKGSKQKIDRGIIGIVESFSESRGNVERERLHSQISIVLDIKALIWLPSRFSQIIQFPFLWDHCICPSRSPQKWVATSKLQKMRQRSQLSSQQRMMAPYCLVL